MSKLLSAISSAFVFGTVLATSPTAFADSYGDQYRGKTRCSDDLTMTVVHRYFSDKDSTFLRDSRVNPMTLNKTWAGKLTILKSSVWMQAEKSTDTSGPSNIVLEKTEDGSAGINLLVCSYEFVPNEKTKVFLVNESIFRMSHDAQKGTKVAAALSNRKGKKTLYVVYLSAESDFRSFAYALTPTSDAPK